MLRITSATWYYYSRLVVSNPYPILFRLVTFLLPSYSSFSSSYTSSSFMH
jgi:hypothetical protein